MGSSSGGLHVRHHRGQLPCRPTTAAEMQKQRVYPGRVLRLRRRHAGQGVPEMRDQVRKRRFDIPFETSWALAAAKVPDIDLNFSGEYQARAHRHAIEMFARPRCFRRGRLARWRRRRLRLCEKVSGGEPDDRRPGEENRLTLGCVESGGPPDSIREDWWWSRRTRAWRISARPAPGGRRRLDTITNPFRIPLHGGQPLKAGHAGPR